MREQGDAFAHTVARRYSLIGALLVILPINALILRADSPCAITNEAQAFVIRGAARTVDGQVILTWESCPDHLYEVQTAENILFQTLWMPKTLMIGSNGLSSWTDPEALTRGQRFYRVQRLTFGGDEDGDGVSNLDEFNRGTDLHKPEPVPAPSNWQPQFSLPASMIVGQTSTLQVVDAPQNCNCQWTLVSGKGFFTNTVNCTTDFRPSWSGAVTVQVACASAGVAYTNWARAAVAFPALSPVPYWNDLPVQYNNNCYNFSTDIRTDTFAQPGVAGGHPAVWPPHDCQPDTAGAITDGLQAGVDIDDLCRTSGLPGGHIVALLVWQDVDYHFVRLEADGTWSSKAGNLPATRLDYSGQPMKDPRTANLGSYRFCGFLWVSPNAHVR